MGWGRPVGVVTRGPATGENTTGGDYAAFVAGPLARRAEAANVSLPGEIEVAESPPVVAFVMRDHWVVACPDCGGDVSMAWDSEPHVYLCPACWNAGVGGLWRPYVFPRERAEIAAVLSARRFPRLRNWVPGESVYTLLVENEELERRAA